MTGCSSKKAFSFPLLALLLAYSLKNMGTVAGLKFWLLLGVSVGAGDILGDHLKDIFLQHRPCFDAFWVLRVNGMENAQYRRAFPLHCPTRLKNLRLTRSRLENPADNIIEKREVFLQAKVSTKRKNVVFHLFQIMFSIWREWNTAHDSALIIESNKNAPIPP